MRNLLRGRNWVKVGVALLALSMFSLAFGADNPFRWESDINDCDVMKYNGEYYITGNWMDGDMLASRDLVNWGQRTQCITSVGGWATDHPYDDHYIHASDPNYVNGVFHLYFQVDTDIGHATSSSPWGMYTEPNPNNPFTYEIDAEYFRDENGNEYFYKVHFSGGNVIYGQTMSDPYTLTGSPVSLISAMSGTWEQTGPTPINEGPAVFKHRDKYYMFYNANGTGMEDYQIGVCVADTPLGFNNSGKYSSPVLPRTFINGSEIVTLGQPWVVRGPNGFEHWLGYFAINQADGGGRYQCVDRIHFYDRTLDVDGPTNRYSAGYHPDPAHPTLQANFDYNNGPLDSAFWTPLNGGTWDVYNKQGRQTDQNTFSFNAVNRPTATQYLIEGNVKFNAPIDSEDKCGMLAFFQDWDNWMIVGLDRVNDNWYAHVKEGGVDTVVGGGYGGSMDYDAYHKIRVERNGSQFKIRIDDMIPPNSNGIVSTGFAGPSQCGLYTDQSTALFDGVIYTIGFDEWDGFVQNWGPNPNGFPEIGDWTTGASGISQNLMTGTNYIFKGDFMAQYEFNAQVYRTQAVPNDGQPHTMGIMPVAIDGNNYFYAEIDLVNNQLQTNGVFNGTPLTVQTAAVAAADNYNIRAVKLPDRVILFVNGQELITEYAAYGPSQVGLINTNMATRYNGILCYQTEPDNVPAPWVSQDIGSVGFAGSVHVNEGYVYMDGSGHDIWDVSDAFQFGYLSWTGDGELTVRVESFDPTDYWAKAALMFREDLTNNSRMAYICLAGSHQDAQFIWRESPGAGTPCKTYNDTSGAIPGYIRIVREADTFSGWYSKDGLNWRMVGACNIDMADTIYLGMAVTSHNNDRRAGAVFDQLALTMPSTYEALPAPWSVTDVGTVSGTGAADFLSLEGMYNMDGTGGDTWGTADGFTFIRQPWSGDVQITARVRFMDWLNLAWTKAGVMIRDDLTASARFARTALCGNGELWAMWREPNATSVQALGATPTPFSAPVWVRATRQNNLFTFSKSADGINWDTISQQTINMDANTEIGLTVNAWDQTFTRNAMFDNVSVTVPPPLDVTPPTPNPMTWATAPYCSGAYSVSMTATTASDTNGVEYYFTCTAGGGSDSGWQDSSSYTDSGLAANTAYSYTVTARDKSVAQNTTAASSVGSATTGPVAPSNAAASGTGTSTMNVTWTDNSSSETGFTVERRLIGGSWSTAGTVGANVTSFGDSGLSEDTTYEYRVKATNGNGSSAWSNTCSGTTDSGGGW